MLKNNDDSDGSGIKMIVVVVLVSRMMGIVLKVIAEVIFVSKMGLVVLINDRNSGICFVVCNYGNCGIRVTNEGSGGIRVG